jgi:uncharacterized membrane protein YeaQ/YmgE (transglycosylase-associated protein family)
VNWLPLGSALIQGDFHLEGGRHLPRGYMVDKPAVSPEYFRVMGIRLLSGRVFSERDNADAPGVVLVTQSVARTLWPGEDPLGERLSMEDDPKPQDWLTIAGVVVVRTAEKPESVATAMRAVLQEVDRSQPVELASMTDLISTTTAEPLFQARLISMFSLLALFLSAIGIYGVLAYAVMERTREIGIRMAFGAEKSDITRMILKRSALLVSVGIVLGVAGALGVTRVLAKFLFDVKPTDPSTFVVVASLLGAVALLAGLVPAWRATRVDPLVALRFE